MRTMKRHSRVTQLIDVTDGLFKSAMVSGTATLDPSQHARVADCELLTALQPNPYASRHRAVTSAIATVPHSRRRTHLHGPCSVGHASDWVIAWFSRRV